MSITVLPRLLPPSATCGRSCASRFSRARRRRWPRSDPIPPRRRRRRRNARAHALRPRLIDPVARRAAAAVRGTSEQLTAAVAGTKTKTNNKRLPGQRPRRNDIIIIISIYFRFNNIIGHRCYRKYCIMWRAYCSVPPIQYAPKSKATVCPARRRCGGVWKGRFDSVTLLRSFLFF